MAKNNLETEQKIELSREDLEKAFAFFKPLRDSDISVKSHPRDYYDTKDQKLRQTCKSTMRVEHKEKGGYALTIKKSQPRDGNSKVDLEWEFESASRVPKYGDISNAQALKTVSDIDETDLRHLFTTNVPAPKFQMDIDLKDGQKGRVEISFDVGEIYLSPKYQIKFNCFARITVCEIEVEYVSGDKAALDYVAKQILDLCPSAKITQTGKGSRGAKLYTQAKATYENAPKISKSSKKAS